MTAVAQPVIQYPKLKDRPDCNWAIRVVWPPGEETRRRAIEGTTAFNREQFLFEAIVAQTARLQEQQPGRTVRILCAPCSIGCEPYTLAMMLDRAGLYENGPIEIVGLDIQESFIEQARAAQYPDMGMASNLPRELQSRYLVPLGGGAFTLRDDIKARVSFMQGDISSFASGTGQPFDFTIALNLLCHMPDRYEGVVSGAPDPSRYAMNPAAKAILDNLSRITSAQGFVIIDQASVSVAMRSYLGCAGANDNNGVADARGCFSAAVSQPQTASPLYGDINSFLIRHGAVRGAPGPEAAATIAAGDQALLAP